MNELISPEFNFELFCYRVLATDPQDPIAVIDMACNESSRARRLHKKTTKETDFRRGSRGRAYCDDIKRCVFVLVNGNFPSDTKPEFIAAFKPLAMKLLQKCEIGELRTLLSTSV
jgi:hypothetical protein